MSARPWMPLYTGDYKRDTGHLTLAQHGAYLLLIMHYWDMGGLPENDEEMARILRVSNKQMLSIWLAIAPFFDEHRHHKRIDAELEKYETIRTKRQISGMKGGLASRGQTNRERILRKANAKQTGDHPQPHSKSTPSVAGLRPQESSLPRKQASELGDGRSLDQIVRDKGWAP